MIVFSTNLLCKTLSFDLPNNEVFLNSKTFKPTFTIYGHYEGKEFVYLKIKGPSQKVILQKKIKVLNMWTWKKSGEFSFPSVFHFYTNNKNNDIDFRIKKNLHDNILLLGNDDDNLKKELIKNKMSTKLFMISNDSFEKIEKKIPSFFKVPVFLPYNSPTGKYEIIMEKMKKNTVIEEKKIEVFVKKKGLNSFIYRFAHNFSFLYGVFCAFVAIVFGLSASFIYRK
tara:strand:+ start:519 stop:1196 length:678 start_codon:yes stop_codon:yes gene_type:complete